MSQRFGCFADAASISASSARGPDHLGIRIRRLQDVLERLARFVQNAALEEGQSGVIVRRWREVAAQRHRAHEASRRLIEILARMMHETEIEMDERFVRKKALCRRQVNERVVIPLEGVLEHPQAEQAMAGLRVPRQHVAEHAFRIRRAPQFQQSLSEVKARILVAGPRRQRAAQ
jgi:hypothetical protein